MELYIHIYQLNGNSISLYWKIIIMELCFKLSEGIVLRKGGVVMDYV